MGKKSRLKKDRAEMAKADRDTSTASEGPSSAATAASSSSIRNIVLPISPSFASVLGPSSSSSSSAPAQGAASPDRPPDFFIGVDAKGDPRVIVRGSEAYEVVTEPANQEPSPDLFTERDDRDASPDPCTRPLSSSPPPSPPSTSLPSGSAGSSSSVSKGSKKQAAGGSSSTSDGSSSSKKRSGGQSSPGRRT
ncbi:putative protein TPRXL [Ananas comosus]|uniref:Uncharacterized protein n=1 Tax=Ananas comosus TaxID=4615 RepID=A0A6P5EA03_ANACO|nr:putative protein TPRXL [Ananas comosus]